MTVFFKNEAILFLKAFGTELKEQSYAKSTDYVTKEQAAKQHTDIMEKIYDFPGENPLQNSFDIHLKADYVEKDSIAKIEKPSCECDDFGYCLR
jgi:cell division transport system permease protein